ncbi:MAG: helicase-related protein, partial [bacterium]
MENQLTAGMIITGPMFPEPVRVISLTAIGTNRTKIEAVGTKTERYYSPILPNFELDLLQSASLTSIDFSGDPEQVFLYLEGLRIRNAYQFDPLFGVSVSRIDPLPHQIEAVYYYILANPRIRFLLADDPGAGKTIMAGLLLKELKYRGLVQRALIIVPGHLKEQWLREMKERFGESFLVVDRAVLNASWGQNAWKENSQIITSLDFAKQDDVRQQLKDSRWDLVIVDEAHKMAAYQYGEKVDKTIRYRFGEDISRIAKHLLFLTATPHRGDPENFRLLLDLLEPGFFANTQMLQASIENRDNPLYLRRLKEDLRDFDGKPLFPPRQVHTLEFPLSPDEKELYEAVTEYVQDNFNRALQKEQRNVAFALTILQRRLASSLRAIRRSLERRRDRLQDLYQRGLLLTEGSGSWDEDRLEDLEDEARTAQEQELMEKLTSAGTLEELAGEIRILEGLCALARQAEHKENETKLVHLRELIEDQRLRQTETKLLLFTESRDTMEYLAEKLRAWGYVVATIHGGLSMDQRITAEHHFRDRAQMLVATEAAGEGINLQFCWLMVNYDIPWNPNRLEQRMGRIHRYGQRHEVHIYNLIAADTREGQVFSALFRKMEVMRAQLGSDRIFDVIGDVLPPGTTLKEMLLDAIAHKRTMEEILATLEYSPN